MGEIRADDAAEAHLAAVRGGQHDVGALDAAEFLEDGARAVAQVGAALPLLQGLPEHVGQEADQDMGLDAVLALMPDRADRQLALVDAKGGFGLSVSWM